jgi:NMD protein affecting ribosome stability and mRNA decay
MSGKDTDIAKHGRHDRLIKERVHDPYMTRSKFPEPTVCPGCGAVFAGGRWVWRAESTDGAHKQMCPACQRIQDRVPAGFLTLRGEFFAKHREEILQLVRNKVQAEAARHPMNRIMDIEDDEDGDAVITFTDTHLPTGVGRAIENAYEGGLDIQYTEEAGIVRVYWER